LEDVSEVKKILEKKEIFARKLDTYSIILGIIKHFKGNYYKKIKKYLEEKEALKKGGVDTIEDALIRYICDEFIEKRKEEYIEIENRVLRADIMDRLGLTEESEYKPSASGIGRKLIKLNLVRKNEDIIRKGKVGNTVYRIYKKVFFDVLNRAYPDLLKEHFPEYKIRKKRIKKYYHIAKSASVVSVPSDSSVKEKITETTEQTEATEAKKPDTNNICLSSKDSSLQQNVQTPTTPQTKKLTYTATEDTVLNLLPVGAEFPFAEWEKLWLQMKQKDPNEAYHLFWEVVKHAEKTGQIYYPKEGLVVRRY
jgi:hypothetical protein